MISFMKQYVVRDMNKISVAIHGTGFIGLVSGCCFATRGIKAINSTFNKGNCERINNGESPFFENGLDELLKEAVSSGNFKCVVGRDKAIEESDISIIAVGTPMRKDNSIDLYFIKQTARQIGHALKKKDEYHLIVVRSTVVPSTTRNLVGKLVEEASGKKMGKDFGLCMQPEFLAEGRSIEDTFKPDRIIIGELDQKSGDILQSLYERFYGNYLENCPILRMNLESAELVKYGNNCLLATKISYANEMARIAELVVGVDIVQVMKGVGLDYRINEEFLGAGVGFGGSCLPKDVNAITAFAKSKGYNPRLLTSVLDINADQTIHVVSLLKKELPDIKGKRIALLGLAFKPGTDDMRFAPSIRIAHHLIDEGASVIGYDPVAEIEAEKILGNSIDYASGVEEALYDADAAIIITEWDEISTIKVEDFKKYMKTPIIIDGRRVYNPEEYNNDIRLVSFGRTEIS